MRGGLAVLTALCVLLAAPAAAQDGEPPACTYGICQVRITPSQLLAQAEALVRAGRFSEAEPMIAALQQAPDLKVQSRFLAGYAASAQGDFKQAAAIFKDILSDDPNQTRVRLELARAMLHLGQTASADRQFRIAQADDLPPDVARIVRGARDVIRSRRLWRLDVDFGLAPDSNINNATAADTINIQLGDLTLPVSLNEDARARSGTGQFATVNAGMRLPVSGKAAVLVDFNGSGTNYAGAGYDDYLVQAGAGPQLHLSDKASVFVQAVGAQRWYAGASASHQFGAKLGGQLAIGDKTRVGVQLDARRTTALFDDNYSGWQLGLYANAERAVSRGFVASAGLFGRRDLLASSSYSNTEIGGSFGIAGELPLGINLGLNATVSRAVFDAPMALFSATPRSDWRYAAGASLGNRKLRWMGFSPALQLSYSKIASSLPLFANDRLRWRFALARYF